jgi:hypothetical protein
VLRWLGQLPAGVLFTLMALVGVAATILLDLGVRRFVHPDTRARAATTAAVTLQVAATIYAILIAFVIVDEYSQLDATQARLSDKAASLATIYENSRAFPEDTGAEIRSATLQYARSVVEDGIPHLAESATPDHDTDRAIEALFTTVHAIEPATAAEQTAYGEIADSLSDLAATREQLIDSARASIPGALFWLLLVIGVLVMVLATMLDTQHRSSHLFILSALALVIWLTLALVLSMDYPFGGIIRVTDAPIREFLEFRASR